MVFIDYILPIIFSLVYLIIISYLFIYLCHPKDKIIANNYPSKILAVIYFSLLFTIFIFSLKLSSKIYN